VVDISMEDAQRYMLGALRRDLSVFTQKSFRYLEPGIQYMHNWHIDAIAEYLMACHTGEIKRLIVNIPPRYMKSLSISVAYPAWALGNDPSKRFLCASYSSTISKKLSIDCRNLCESRWFNAAFPSFKMRDDQNTKDKFMTTENGFRMATSITGSATGEGGNCLHGSTLVKTTDGSIQISRLVEDYSDIKVIGFNHKDNEHQECAVVAHRIVESDQAAIVRIGNGFSVTCTPEHRFFTKSRGYQEAQDLRLDDWLFYEGDFWAIHSVELMNLGYSEKFYDIQTEPTNNFYANGILVHNCLIADDPLNPKQAGSDVERKRVNEWFDQTFTSRLNDKKNGVIIVVQQRLHPDDLTGHLLEKGGWEHLNIPAIAPERTIISYGGFERVREENEVLHPAREDKEMLDRMRRDMGTHVFQSQYQQNPRGTEGAMVNLAWFPRYEKTNPETKSIVLSWDFAQKVGQGNDFTACTVWGITPNNYQLLHVYNRKLTFGQARDFVKLMNERWEPQVHLMEDKSAGTAIIQDLRETTTIPIIAMQPGASDKASRLLSVVGTMESGKVELPKEADWLLKFEEQLCDFPNVKHDDMVDTMTQFLRWAIRRNKKTRDIPAPICVGGGVDTVLLI